MKNKKTDTLRVTWRKNLIRLLVGCRLGVRDTMRDPVLIVWQRLFNCHLNVPWEHTNLRELQNQVEGWCVYAWDVRQGPDRACFSSWSGSNPRSTSYAHMPKQNRAGSRPWGLATWVQTRVWRMSWSRHEYQISCTVCGNAPVHDHSYHCGGCAISLILRSCTISLIPLFCHFPHLVHVLVINKRSCQKKIPKCFLRKEIPAKKRVHRNFRTFRTLDFRISMPSLSTKVQLIPNWDTSLSRKVNDLWKYRGVAFPRET